MANQSKIDAVAELVRAFTVRTAKGIGEVKGALAALAEEIDALKAQAPEELDFSGLDAAVEEAGVKAGELDDIVEDAPVVEVPGDGEGEGGEGEGGEGEEPGAEEPTDPVVDPIEGDEQV